MSKTLLALLVFLGFAMTPAFAESQVDRHQCNSVNPERAIAGCTAFLDGRRAHSDSIVWAYSRRAKAYTSLGEYRMAIQDLDTALQRYPGSYHPLQERGRTHFFLGNFAYAAQDFDQVIRSRSKTSFDAIWRYLAIARAGGNGRTLLQSDAAHLEMKNWPGPLIKMFLGQSDPEVVLAAARSNSEQLQSENLCEAYFYVGQYYLLRDDIAAAMDAFRLALGTNAYTFVEYRGAYEELRRLGETFPADDPRLKTLFPLGETTPSSH